MYCEGGGNFLGTGGGIMSGNPSYVNQLNTGYSRDAFGRIVMGTPTTLASGHVSFTPQYERVDYASTLTGFISTIPISSLVTFSVSGSGGRCIRQTQEYQLYQPNKSHLATFTFIPKFAGTFDNSVAFRVGIYDDYRDKNTPFGLTPPSSIYGGTGVEVNQPSMGHFFELSGNQWFVVERANSPDNIQNVNRVPQQLWNVDTFNPSLGVNPSGYLLTNDPKEGLLFWIERQWLGVGIVRMGAYFNGRPVVCHIFQQRGYQFPYTHLNKLPIRYELEKVTGGTSLAATSASICWSSQIMGNYTPLGTIFSLPAPFSLTVSTVSSTFRPLLFLRLNPLYCRATFKLKDIDIFVSNNQAIAYSVIKNPIVGGGTITWVDYPDTRSLVQYAYPGTTTTLTLTDGMTFRAGYINANSVLQDSLTVDELLTAHSFCSNIQGVPDICCIAAIRATNSDATVLANARWLEIV